MSSPATRTVFRAFPPVGISIHTFRKMKNPIVKLDQLIAIFPDLTGWNGQCSTYCHIGQHCDSHPRLVVDVTRPVTIEQATPLIKELHQLGYTLDIRKRR